MSKANELSLITSKIALENEFKELKFAHNKLIFEFELCKKEYALCKKEFALCRNQFKKLKLCAKQTERSNIFINRILAKLSILAKSLEEYNTNAEKANDKTSDMDIIEIED